MKKMLKILLPLVITTSSAFSQNIEANWQCHFIWSEWDFVVRDSLGVADSSASHTLTMSWPSSDFNAVTLPYKSYQVGDTITSLIKPLITPDLLGLYGINLNTNFNNDGTFTINDGSSYPTTETIDCATGTVVLPVAESGFWLSGPGFWHDTMNDPWGPIFGQGTVMEGTFYTYGNGIGESGVFPNYDPVDITTGTYGEDFGAGADHQSWGQTTIGYADTSGNTPNFMQVYWENYQGPETGSGWDELNEEYTTITGVSMHTGDTTSIPSFAALASAVGIDINVSTDYPMLGGPGVMTDSVSVLTGEPVYTGQVSSNHVYYFDPAGADGEYFSGDEPFAPTGYYLTYNWIEAQMMFEGVMDAYLANGADLETAVTAAVDSVAFIYVGSDTSEAVAAQVATALMAAYNGCLDAGASEEACSAVFSSGPTASLSYLQAACPECPINDSDVDGGVTEDGYPIVGRLVFEIDNVCIPNFTTNRPTSRWYNTALVEIDEDAPVASSFELHGNYPNPFNPSTSIKFSTERFSDVTVTIYSLIGQKVQTIHNGELMAGTYDVKWYGTDVSGNKVPSGVYFYEVRSGDRIKTGKMLLLK